MVPLDPILWDEPIPLGYGLVPEDGVQGDHGSQAVSHALHSVPDQHLPVHVEEELPPPVQGDCLVPEECMPVVVVGAGLGVLPQVPQPGLWLRGGVGGIGWRVSVHIYHSCHTLGSLCCYLLPCPSSKVGWEEFLRHWHQEPHVLSLDEDLHQRLPEQFLAHIVSD